MEHCRLVWSAGVLVSALVVIGTLSLFSGCTNEDPAKFALVEPLHRAAAADDVARVESLIEEGCNLNARDSFGYTPLMTACKNGAFAAAKALLARGARVNLYASGAGKVCAMTDDCGGSALILIFHRRLDKRSIDLMKLLLASGANVNATDGRGCTALEWACRQSPFSAHYGEEAIKVLLKHGARRSTSRRCRRVPCRGLTEIQKSKPRRDQ